MMMTLTRTLRQVGASTVFLLVAAFASSGCGSSDGARQDPTSTRAAAPVHNTSLATCVAAVGSPYNPESFDAAEAKVLRSAAANGAVIIAPEDDDFWLAITAKSSASARAIGRQLQATIPRELFDIKIRGKNVASVPSRTSPMHAVLDGEPSVIVLRLCTAQYESM